MIWDPPNIRNFQSGFLSFLNFLLCPNAIFALILEVMWDPLVKVVLRKYIFSYMTRTRDLYILS